MSSNNYWQDIRKHQVNTSPSKSTYGFPKQQRFRSTSKILCDSFYNIPSTLGRSPKSGIGYGKRVDLAGKSMSPSPNNYQIKSDFNLSKRNVSMGKFALGRQSTKQNGIFQKNLNPAPGNYQIRTTLVSKNPISMHPRLPFLHPSYQNSPSPAHYQQPSTLTSTGRYISSNVQNTPGVKIKDSKLYDPSKARKVPGPGAYNLEKENMNTTGNYFNSKMHNSRSRTFMREKREDKSMTARGKLPGPGAYQVFTDFGASRT